jgi:hypothetical protein
MRMMCSLLVIARKMVSGCFAVMASRVLVVLCCLFVMGRAFVRCHQFSGWGGAASVGGHPQWWKQAAVTPL